MTRKPILVPLTLNNDVSGTKEITSNGDYDVRHYASVSVNVQTEEDPGGDVPPSPVPPAMQTITLAEYVEMVNSDTIDTDTTYYVEL